MKFNSSKMILPARKKPSTFLHEARAEFFSRVGDYTQAIEQLDYAKRRASNNYPLAARIDARQQVLIQEEEAIKQMLR